MKDTFKTTYLDGMAFETEISGHKLIMDAHDEVGGEDRGPRPKPLIMAALSGCTGMDVVSILKKMQVTYDTFEILIESEMTEEHPKTYSKIHMIYMFKGTDLPVAKIEKAVKLSQERYCGVSALLDKALDLTYEIKIEG
jgi:putative redox protein